MKKLKLLYISIILVVSGCMDLEETPQSSLSPENFFTSVDQVNSVYTNAMAQVWNLWANRGYSYGWQYFVVDDQLGGIYEKGLIIGPNHASELWAAHYAALLNINGSLKAINDGKVKNASEAQINELIGVGKFLRAFNYFQLVRLWGGVPLYLENDDPGIAPEGRASVEDIYISVVDDFTDAIAKLPEEWIDGSNGKPTISAAKALLAKVYLTMATAPLNQTENYAKAASLAKEVMESEKYSLIQNIDEIFLIENKYGPETIWSFNSTKDDPSTPGQIWGSESPYTGWGDFSIDMTWDSLFVQQPRKEAFTIDSVDGKYYTEWTTGIAPMVKKYLPPNISWDDLASYEPTNNVPIIRFADVLLIFAEADNMANGAPSAAAVDAVNQVIERANGYIINPDYPLLTTAMSKDAFDEAVIQERNLELCFEFDRWFDICRKRLLEKLILPGQPLYKFRADYSENDYLFPIPDVELRLNKLEIQNPGYPTP
jgi:starch-binding outer membrane protein, SusD/RagB family